jgi:hypothetical protein
MFRKFKKIKTAAACFLTAATLFCVVYVRRHPLVFNESLFMHAHCIKIIRLAFDGYAEDHGGRFPTDTNGYGSALLQLTNYTANFWEGMTGPGYDGNIFEKAARTGERIPELECGRVYVQGLSQTNDPDIAFFFDKIPSPGGDHCHFPFRLYAPLGREVCTIGSGGYRFVRETDWAAYSKTQIDLLIKAGIPKARAEEYYAETRERPAL